MSSGFFVFSRGLVVFGYIFVRILHSSFHSVRQSQVCFFTPFFTFVNDFDTFVKKMKYFVKNFVVLSIFVNYFGIIF